MESQLIRNSAEPKRAAKPEWKVAFLENQQSWGLTAVGRRYDSREGINACVCVCQILVPPCHFLRAGACFRNRELKEGGGGLNSNRDSKFFGS